MSCCIWRCAPMTAPRGSRPARVQLRARLHHQRHPARRTRLCDRFPPAASTCRARATKSAEEIVLEMRRNAELMQSRTQVWEGKHASVRRVFGPGGRQRRPPAQRPANAGDVLADETRARDVSRRRAGSGRSARPRSTTLAARGLALAKAIGAMKGRGTMRRRHEPQVSRAARPLPRRPGSMALQRWIEVVAPGERTFTRPSRRGAERADVVLPGRKRQSWMLNVVLDTSRLDDRRDPARARRHRRFLRCRRRRSGPPRAMRHRRHRGRCAVARATRRLSRSAATAAAICRRRC